MASLPRIPALLLRQTTFRCPGCLRPEIPIQFTRASSQKFKKNTVTKAQTQKKKAAMVNFKTPNVKKYAQQYSLLDAIRYIRAFEVGRDPSTTKYELALRLDTARNGAVIRNRMRLPHPVDTSARVAVIVDPSSKEARAAKQAGAVLVGEESIFEAVKAGRIEFDRLLCHQDSLQKLNEANVGRILGPRGLMPSVKTATVVKNAAQAVADVGGGTEYRERTGVIRLAIAQLGFTPDEVSRNITAFMANIKKDCNNLSDRTPKSVHEVVLSSTRSPGFSLNGTFQSEDSVPVEALATL